MKKKVVALLCVLTMLVAMFSGCGGKKAEETDNKTTPAVTSGAEATQATAAPEAGKETAAAYTEAPVLAEIVKAGTLPAVEERLPEAEDIMVETMDSIGTYGEAINFTFRGKESQWSYS